MTTEELNGVTVPWQASSEHRDHSRKLLSSSLWHHTKGPGARLFPDRHRKGP